MRENSRILTDIRQKEIGLVQVFGINSAPSSKAKRLRDKAVGESLDQLVPVIRI